MQTAIHYRCGAVKNICVQAATKMASPVASHTSAFVLLLSEAPPDRAGREIPQGGMSLTSGFHFIAAKNIRSAMQNFLRTCVEKSCSNKNGHLLQILSKKAQHGYRR